MSTLMIKNGRVITPEGVLQHGWVRCVNGKIEAVGEGAPPETDATYIDADDKIVAPGFIDLHIHGSVGQDTMDATPEAFIWIARFIARHGCTSFLPTTWTDSRERIENALQAALSIQGAPTDGAQVLGIHLEGPYLNPVRSGAQHTGYIRRAERDEALDFLNHNVIKLLALAPEYPENHWLISECIERGIAVSLAHSDASYEETLAAVDLGLTQSTHTFNAQPPLNHRQPGAVGAILTDPRIRCEVIVDGIHVHPAMVKLIALAKGIEGVILITDAMRAAGMPDGEYPLYDTYATLKEGAIRLANGSLAGSVLTFDQAVRNFIQFTGFSFFEMWPATSLNAAHQIGLGDVKGSIEVGKDADFVILTEDIEVSATVVGGRIVYQQ